MAVSALQPVLLVAISIGGESARSFLEANLQLTLHAHRKGVDDTYDPSFSHRPLRLNCVWATAPLIRLWLSLLSSVGAALLATSLPSQTSAEMSLSEASVALYALGAVTTEVDELISHHAFRKSPLLSILSHLSDPWNLIDALALLLVGLALFLRRSQGTPTLVGDGADAQQWQLDDGVLPFTEGSASEGTDPATRVLAYSVFLLYLRPLKFLYLSRWLGPFLYMVTAMLSDLIKIGLLVLLMQPAFLAAQHILFRSLGPDAGCGLFGDSLGDSLVALNEVFIGQRSPALDCLRLSPQHYWSWALQLVYSMITILLLLNMLRDIALSTMRF